MKLSAIFKVDIDELMVNGLTAVVDEISYWDETSLIEIVSEAACHNCSITIVEHLSKSCFIKVLKLLSFLQIGHKLILKFLAFYADMDNFLNEGPIESL
jgi:hypothetical protein